MSFIRFFKPIKNTQFISQVLKSNHDCDNIPSDLLSGFETKNQTLSLFKFNDQQEKNKIICHYEFNMKKMKGLSNEISYFEFTDIYINSFFNTIKNNPLIDQQIIDPSIAPFHYDICNIDTKNLVNFLYNINQDIGDTNLKIHSLDKIKLVNIIKSTYPKAEYFLKVKYKSEWEQYYTNLQP